jgi:alpha-L-fucosidase
MTMANSWSYVPGDQYKSTATLLKNLCLIVSRGGNFLLNIAPDPQGRFDSIAYQRLEEIGAWMQVNGEAIYNSKPIAPYEVKDAKNGTWVFTQVEKAIYAIWIPGESARQTAELNLSSFGKKKVQALNPNNQTKLKNGVLSVEIRNNPLNTPQVFRLQ